MTAQTPERLITRTMRGIGFLGRYATPKANETEDAFDTLCEMMDSWNLESTILPYTVQTPLPLVANQSLYSVGPTGTDLVIIPRPERLKQVICQLGSTPNYQDMPTRLIEDSSEWARIVAKYSTGSRAYHIWYNPKNPDAELNVYPVPSQTGRLMLYYQDKFVRFTSLTEEINLPDGLLRALRYNLGVELAPELGVSLPPLWLEKSVSSLAKVMSRNIVHGKLELETVI